MYALDVNATFRISAQSFPLDGNFASKYLKYKKDSGQAGKIKSKMI